jgi:hypothetical protein
MRYAESSMARGSGTGSPSTCSSTRRPGPADVFEQRVEAVEPRLRRQLMVAVFAVFITLSMLFFKQFGVGLAAAILIDATVVRAVLLPATMKLLDAWNWDLPSWLEWLPHLEPEEQPTTPDAKPATVSG